VTSPRLALALLAITESCSWGCAATQDSGYAAANADCVALAKSTAQSELCVSRIQTTYCGEGGLNAPMCTSGKDAGHE
jgi:hypothetical protein